MTIYTKAVLLGLGMGIVGACVAGLLAAVGVAYHVALEVGVAMVVASMALLKRHRGGSSTP